MANRWEDVDELFVRSATDDLVQRGEIQPALAAFAGDRLRFLAWIRPFEKGAYHKPLIELYALAGPLDADRIAVSMPARAWSLKDPIPPVSADADLRQRVLVVHLVDGSHGRPRCSSILHPFEEGDEGPSWQEPQRLPGGEGWIFAATELAVTKRTSLRTSDREIRKQAIRVSRLGHDLYLATDLHDRLALRPQPT